MEVIAKGAWMGTDLIDMRGTPFRVGQLVAKAVTFGRAVNIELREVTRIENGKMYLGGSKVAVRFPQRCVVVEDVQ